MAWLFCLSLYLGGHSQPPAPVVVGWTIVYVPAGYGATMVVPTTQLPGNFPRLKAQLP